MKYSVVGQQGNAYWFETTQESYYHRNDIRLLIAIGDRRDPATYDVQNFAMRTDGKLQDYPPGMLGLFKSLYKPIVDNLVVNWVNLPREGVRVAAGEFESCFKQRASFSFGPYRQTSDGWSHPSVPINGLVRSVGVDKPITMELVAFGTEARRACSEAKPRGSVFGERTAVRRQILLSGLRTAELVRAVEAQQQAARVVHDDRVALDELLPGELFLSGQVRGEQPHQRFGDRAMKLLGGTEARRVAPDVFRQTLDRDLERELSHVQPARTHVAPVVELARIERAGTELVQKLGVAEHATG